MASPVMLAGAAGTERTVSERAVLLPQPLVAATFTVPLTKPAGKVTEMELVPSPLLMIALAGTVQLYDDAPVVETGQV